MFHKTTCIYKNRNTLKKLGFIFTEFDDGDDDTQTVNAIDI